jgi:pyruvate/2-oxoglutarate dehydrogenase complex dihydrolipoamide acyltransferase (E2) component
MADKQFGTNLWLVDEMYEEYLESPESVSETWQEFFSDYRPSWEPGNGDRIRTDGRRRPARETETPAPERDGAAAKDTARPIPEDAKPLRGVSATIAGNMRDSLDVPTATSIRVVPAKLLEVNRKILNNQLRRTRGGKVSFTDAAAARDAVDLPRRR